MLGEAFPAARSGPPGVALTAGVATALIGVTPPWIDQILVGVTAGDMAPGVYAAAIALPRPTSASDMARDGLQQNLD